MFQKYSFSTATDASVEPNACALRVGLIGTGVVGSGTCQVLARNADLIAQRAGRPIHLVMATARNLHKAAQVVGPDVALVSDPWVVVRHPGIDVVVEVMGGVGLAKELVLEAIAQGKHVVTANKALLAEHGAEIFAAADARSVVVAYEAAVAVSIPIIKALREGLAANAFGADVPFAQVHAQGITALDPWDMVCAQALGYRIKLLGIARQRADAIEVRVHPTLVPQKHWLAQVQGSMNGIWVNTDAAGPTFHYGAGAGSQTTASAVVADLIDVARCGAAGDAGRAALRVPHRSVQASAVRHWPVQPIGQVFSRHYLRFELNEHPELQAEWPRRLQAHGVEVQHMAQVPYPGHPHRKAWVALTQSLRGDDLTRAVTSLSQQTGGVAAAAIYRVEDLA